MQQTPEEKTIAEVMQLMGFIKPWNTSQTFQRPAPIIAEPEPEGTEEQRAANEKNIAQILRTLGYRHPNDLT